MILATHAVAGALVSGMFPDEPIIGFIAAFGSHFVLDAIPHWEYRILSLHREKERGLGGYMESGRTFVLDLVRTGADFGAGVLLAFFTAGSGVPVFAVVAGIIGGVLPDALQLAYWKLRKEPLASLQRFHLFIHARKKLQHPSWLLAQAGLLILLTVLLA